MCHDAGFAGQLEKEFTKRIGSKYGVAENSAVSLLHASVNAAGAGASDEVVYDPIVQFGAIAAMYNNAHPVFADLTPDTWLMDPKSVEKRITDRTNR